MRLNPFWFPDPKSKSMEGTMMTWRRFSFAALAAVILMPARAEYPSAGTDEFDSSARVTVDLTMSGGPEFPVTADGRTTIVRGAPRPDTGDGRSAIDTEIVSMALRAVTPIGPIAITESPTRTSAGVVQQQEPGTDFPADSFFDVFVEIETPLGTLHNETAIRLSATIDALPPFQAEYIPKETFVGVDLFNASGQKVGVIKHAAHFVGQKPSFSVAPGGTSVLRAADIFDPPTAVQIPAEELGLSAQNAPADDVDGLSYGTAYINNWVMDLRFSVDPMSVGAGAVFVESQKGEAHGDEFMALKGGNTNRQILDENGDTAPPFPLLISDDVDSLALPPTSYVDPDGDGTPDRDVYFSLGAGSPSLAALGFTPGDILVSSGGAVPTKYIGYDELGLTDTDDVDAFCLDATNRWVVYSLARNSTSLTGGLSPADLFIAAPLPASSPVVFADAAELGLMSSDNLNALKCIPAEVDHYPFARASVVLNGQPLELEGTAIALVGIGPNGETPQNIPSTSGDSVPIELIQLSLTGMNPLVGDIEVMLRSPFDFPNTRSGGALFETENHTIGVFDVSPFGEEGPGVASMQVALEASAGGIAGLHHPDPIPIFGDITHKPFASGNVLHSSGTTELFLEGEIPSGIFISDLSLELNGALPPELDIDIYDGGIVRATDAAAGVTADSIGALYGQNFLAESDTTPAAAARRSAEGELSVTVRDSDGAESVAQIFAAAPTQINVLFGPDLAEGPAIVTVTRADGRNASGSVQVLDVVPGLFSANFTGTGVAAANFLRVAEDGTRTSSLIFDANTLESIPLDLSPEGDSVYLLMYGTGFREGTDFSASVGGVPTTVLGAVAQGEFDGLDQLNIGPLSRDLIGRGEVDIEFTADGKTANVVTVNIQ